MLCRKDEEDDYNDDDDLGDDEADDYDNDITDIRGLAESSRTRIQVLLLQI